jgi:hypothetical protein
VVRSGPDSVHGGLMEGGGCYLLDNQPGKLLRLSRSVGGCGLSGFGIRSAPCLKTSTISPLNMERCVGRRPRLGLTFSFLPNL